MTQPLFADCEGDNFLPDLTKIWTIQLAEGVDGDVTVYADHPDYPPLKDALAKLEAAEEVVFHNGMGYDLFAINKVYPGTLRPEQIIDTLVLARMMGNAMRNSLKEIGEALGFPKGDHDDFSKFSHAMAKYGAQDVRILQRMWKGDKKRKVRSWGRFYKKFQRAAQIEFYTAYVIQKQVNHGFRLDLKEAQMLEAEFRQELKDLETELQKVFPPIVTERYSEKQVDKITGKPKRLKDKVEVFNPGSRDQIADRLIARYGWKPTKKTPGGKAKVDETVLEELEYPEAKLFLRYLNVSKMLGQVAEGKNAWLRLAEEQEDGTHKMFGFVNTLGARTTRMSHSRPNMAQVSTKDRRMREVWLPDPGHVLVGVDAEGLELRMLAHYLFPYDNGIYAETVHKGDKSKGTDIHTLNMKAANLYLRNSAKTMIYAHNYGCGDRKLGIIVVEDAREAGKPIPTQSLTQIGKDLRKKLETGVTGLKDLIAKSKKSNKLKEALPGLDGRWIKGAGDNAALNTLLQGNGSIVMKVALNEFDREIQRLGIEDLMGWKTPQFGYCANVHDEFQVSAHPDVAEKAAEVGKWSITRAGEILGVRCPLVGDAMQGQNWAETH